MNNPLKYLSTHTRRVIRQTPNASFVFRDQPCIGARAVAESMLIRKFAKARVFVDWVQPSTPTSDPLENYACIVNDVCGDYHYDEVQVPVGIECIQVQHQLEDKVLIGICDQISVVSHGDQTFTFYVFERKNINETEVNYTIDTLKHQLLIYENVLQVYLYTFILEIMCNLLIGATCNIEIRPVLVGMHRSLAVAAPLPPFIAQDNIYLNATTVRGIEEIVRPFSNLCIYKPLTCHNCNATLDNGLSVDNYQFYCKRCTGAQALQVEF